MQIQAALELYLAQLEADGRSPHTIGQARRHVRALEGWLVKTGRSTDLDDLDHRGLALLFADPAARDRPDGQRKKATTLNAMRSTLRTFFAFLSAADIVSTNPARLLRRARCAPPPPRALTDDEAQRLLAVLAAAKGQAARRDEALVVLLLGAGLRLGAALGLDVEDLDLVRGEAHVRRDKGNRPETVILPPAVVEHLRRFLGDRTAGPLFRVGTGGRLSTRQAQRRFAGWVRAAEIDRPVSPHSCRHTFATTLLATTGNLRLVQRALRHRSIASTSIYAATDDQELRRALMMPTTLPRGTKPTTNER